MRPDDGGNYLRRGCLVRIVLVRIDRKLSADDLTRAGPEMTVMQRGTRMVLTAPFTEMIDHAGYFIQLGRASIPAWADHRRSGCRWSSSSAAILSTVCAISRSS